MTPLIQRIKELTRIYHAETIAIRRYLHLHPELSGEEKETSAFVAKTLSKLGISYRDHVGGYGIVADITGKSSEGRCVALRADMDALALTELNDITYKSLNPGVMHACGHDAHTAVLLTAARIINELKQEFHGTIRLIFQPSEERFPGGALPMIADGALMNPVPDYIFGAHVFPDLEAGKAGMRTGAYMASTDEVYLTIKGRGGHAATPHINIDPVLMGANILIALQQVASRLAPPTIPTVLSFGRLIADGRTNIIPDEVKLEGTFRTFDEGWRKQAHEHITLIAQKTAESMGGTCEVFIDKGYPFLVNDEAATSIARTLATEYLSPENVVELDQRMTAEDFAYFSQSIPACFYRFGIRNEEKGITSNLHSPRFNIDEKSLESAPGLMAWIALGAMAWPR